MVDMKALVLGCGFLVAGFVPCHADCDNSSLSGVYPFVTSGFTVGIYDPSGTLQPFAVPEPLSSVGQYSFDGQGNFTRVDYNVGNGVPVNTASTPVNDSGFRTGQTGTYSIASDCTGTLSLSANGASIVLQLVVVDFGAKVHAIVASEHVPGFNPALLPPGTTCASGCDEGVNILAEFTKDAWGRPR